MYHLIKIRAEYETAPNRSVYEEKLYKIRDFRDITEIDWGEWNELTDLGVKELYLSEFENMRNTAKDLMSKQKKLQDKLNRSIPKRT